MAPNPSEFLRPHRLRLDHRYRHAVACGCVDRVRHLRRDIAARRFASGRTPRFVQQFDLDAYWMGNSQAVAKKHYLQVTEEHFATAQITAQTVANSTRQDETPEEEKTKMSVTVSDGQHCTGGSNFFAIDRAAVDLLETQLLVQRACRGVLLHGLHFDEAVTLFGGLPKNFSHER
jgi:hypothetical protein